MVSVKNIHCHSFSIGLLKEQDIRYVNEKNNQMQFFDGRRRERYDTKPDCC